MKKKIAVVLCLVLCSMSFFGCSSAELGLLQMTKDITKITEYELSGNVEVFYDAEKLKKFLGETIESTEYTKEEIVAQLSSLSGSKKINLKYNGNIKVNSEDLSLYLNIDGTIDGKAAPLGAIYASLKEGVYVEKALLLNLYKSSELLVPEEKDSYFYSDEYGKAFEAALGSSEYIEIVSAEAMTEMFTEEGIKSMLEGYATQNEQIYTAAIKFITDAFSGYSTNVVKGNATAYEISVDGEDVAKIISDVLDYCSSNIDAVADSLEVYMKAVMEIMMNSYPPEVQKQLQEGADTFKIDKEHRLEFAQSIAAIRATLDYWAIDKKQDLKALSYKEAVKKVDNTYTGTSQLQLNQDGSNLAYIKSESKVAEKKFSIEIPKSGTPMADVLEKIAAVEKKYNPVTTLKVTWEKYSEQTGDETYYCDINYSNKYDSPFQAKEKYDWSEYYNINKEMYVGLRDICDILDEKLEWDNKAKSAYVMKDGKKVVMNSILRDGESYVKLRSFEKLGYTVVYDGSVAGQHNVTISTK